MGCTAYIVRSEIRAHSQIRQLSYCANHTNYTAANPALQTSLLAALTASNFKAKKP